MDINPQNYRNKLVFDIEANGLLEDSTEIWCICGKWVDRDGRFSLSDKDGDLNFIHNLLDTDLLIGHNIINYDIPMIRKFYGIDLIETLGIERICDTYILSQLLYPDRQLPKGCPESIYNPVLKKSKKVGPHSLEAWGYRCGHKKIEIHDWRTFTPDIITRCEVDVDINVETYFKLMKEVGYD